MTQPLTDAINALTRYANETTGQSDTNLSDAVRTLCDGFGKSIDWDLYIQNEEPVFDIVLETTTTVPDYAFYRKPIESIESNSVNILGSYSFNGCTRLKRVNLPRCLHTRGGGNYVFAGCTELEEIYLPLFDTPQGSSFLDGCSKLRIADIPSVSRLSGSFFRNCSVLPIIDLNANCSAIDAQCFSGCHSLASIVMRCTNVVTLANVNAFANTPMRGYNGLTGKVYVPSALIESYKTATNWATIFAEGHMTFEAIEGSQYENYYADGTPIE